MPVLQSSTYNVIFVSPSLDKDIPLYEESLAASAVITPGMMVEVFDDSGTSKVRPHSADTRIPTMLIADFDPMTNQGIADTYAIGDHPPCRWLPLGGIFNGIIPSGQDISKEELLQSNGDGKFKTASAATADAGLAKFQSKQAIGSVTADTRCLIVRIA